MCLVFFGSFGFWRNNGGFFLFFRVLLFFSVVSFYTLVFVFDSAVGSQSRFQSCYVFSDVQLNDGVIVVYWA